MQRPARIFPGIMEYCISDEQEFAKKHLPHPVRVYMTVGDVELTRPAFEKFAATMAARKYPSVSLQSKILENTGHGGTNKVKPMPVGYNMFLKGRN